MTSKAAIIANLMSENAALKEKYCKLEETWSYFQSFCKAHGSTGITDLVVQRDSLLAALEQTRDALLKVVAECGGCEHEDGVCCCAEYTAIGSANCAIAMTTEKKND